MIRYVYFVCILFGSVRTQYDYDEDTPCPNVYQEERDLNGDYGIIKFKSPPLGSCVYLELYMRTDRVVGKDYEAYIQMLESREKNLQQIVNGRSLRYKIDFPYLIKPKLDYIILNGQIICKRDEPYRRNGNWTILYARHILLADDKGLELQNLTKSVCNEVTSTNYNLYKLKPGDKDDMSNIKNWHSYCGRASEKLSLQSVTSQFGDWPWLTMIYHKKVTGLNFICTGTLISDQHIITAANCFKEQMNKEITSNDILMNFGAHDIEDFIGEKSVLMPAHYIHIHPFYDGGLGLKHNVAIVVVEPITMSHHIHPICLWNTLPPQNSYNMMVGWLRGDKKEPALTIPLQVLIETKSSCDEQFPYFKNYLTQNSLCGDKFYSDASLKDIIFSYGSGLYASTQENFWVLRGVLSFNLHNITSKSPIRYHIFTEIPKYIVWIERVMKLKTAELIKNNKGSVKIENRNFDARVKDISNNTRG